jgi:hypothetical protein
METVNFRLRIQDKLNKLQAEISELTRLYIKADAILGGYIKGRCYGAGNFVGRIDDIGYLPNHPVIDMELRGMFFNLKDCKVLTSATAKTEDLANFEPLTEAEFDKLILETLKDYGR